MGREMMGRGGTHLIPSGVSKRGDASVSTHELPCPQAQVSKEAYTEGKMACELRHSGIPKKKFWNTNSGAVVFWEKKSCKKKMAC
jgi:hypothetical protein